MDVTPIATCRPLYETNPPFRFTYDKRSSSDFLQNWRRTETIDENSRGKAIRTIRYLDPQTGLQLTCETTSFQEFPARDWVLYFENTGSKDTPIIEDIRVLDTDFPARADSNPPFMLHRTNGAPSNPADFEVQEIILNGNDSICLGGGHGRSSNKDFPFFRLDSGAGTAIFAVGWSGQWKADFACKGGTSLHLSAGLETAHFLLHPGEKVRMLRMLVMIAQKEPADLHNQFRRLIALHYMAPKNGKKVEKPFLFCNTCFTRGGMWLNECNEENQISLINALAPLGVEAVITDAGWFTGGWPQGAGNWDARKDSYPNGIAPVAKAAKDNGMTYGLWFEPERVVGGTTIDREHPEWLLWTKDRAWNTALLNFGIPEVRQYFLDILGGYMQLPGFRVYRQDFNANPLAYWRDNEEPNRQGITEIKYIEGLYAYWDAIAAAYPDSFREECASGGRRIDLETVMRMHVHQKSDLWFNNEVDQASLMALSHYLPNGVISVPVNRLDDYSFHSAMASSLIPGWIADAEDFDIKGAKQIADLYRQVRHIFNADFYPLTDCSRDIDKWLASQYHDPKTNEGVILAFRREQCPDDTLQVKLQGLNPKASYRLIFVTTNELKEASGEALMDAFEISIPKKPGSELFVYRKA